MMDVDGSGTITFEELKAGLKRIGSNLNDMEIKELMDAVSPRGGEGEGKGGLMGLEGEDGKLSGGGLCWGAYNDECGSFTAFHL